MNAEIGRCVLVTGGTGSFGQAFARAVLARDDQCRIVVFSRDEQRQFEMRRVFGTARVRYIIGDVRETGSLQRACSGVDTIVHTAALKQVAAAEENPLETVETNILGAANVIDAAVNNEVARVIAISTDKAVYPTNLYGATKLIADKLFVSANERSPASLFSVIRLGNFASRGSVVPFFQRLVLEGAQEVPVTDLRMTRFWIGLSEAVDFAFDCLKRMYGGEIFFPRMPSVRVSDIAAAFAPGLRITVTGIGPGEKLHESLCTKEETRRILHFGQHYVVPPMRPPVDYSLDAMGETGSPVSEHFEYTSENNEQFLSPEELRRYEG